MWSLYIHRHCLHSSQHCWNFLWHFNYTLQEYAFEILVFFHLLSIKRKSWHNCPSVTCGHRPECSRSHHDAETHTEGLWLSISHCPGKVIAYSREHLFFSGCVGLHCSQTACHMLEALLHDYCSFLSNFFSNKTQIMLSRPAEASSLFPQPLHCGVPGPEAGRESLGTSLTLQDQCRVGILGRHIFPLCCMSLTRLCWPTVILNTDSSFCLFSLVTSGFCILVFL